MKKLLNDPSEMVDEMVDGIVAAYPDHTRRLDDTNVIVRNDAPVSGKVGVVSGGGSGHEPTHAGFVGEGMLDGAAAGEVFTSPTADELSEMIQACDGGAGVLCVVKNYEGDVMNFDTAAEMAELSGVDTVEQVVVNDDVAVEDSTYTSGRRGVQGTIFVHKCAGALAERGADIEEVVRVAEKVIDNVGSMGMALTSCVTPEKGEPTFDIDDDEIEIGIGIHGEPGVERTELVEADAIAERLTNEVLDDVQPSGEVAVMVNGMGGTPQSELFVVNRTVQELLVDNGLAPWNTWVGNYMTSLDMAGCSVTILDLDEELMELLDSPTTAPAFKTK
ncbi:dihydroxyacetone kinase subunit DhaK [Halocatena salina]|uniref:Dihydroxyacetone kinase subunit DhaK n=1 Tax=Halocatena salina TaxID=2934340 RepID=A0A8U0A6K2_9EURY|nr:dihydroxyacetone kinase subunit DhaK [Halocatena salina]UPM44811.1 dihydroxyacetone kinase subunit DhaK [Halocatena salina]